jgi:uncharacterized protein YprB with RNaseH-like and TPR domain
MQLEAQDFLKMVEKGKGLVFVDIESTGLKGDYGSTLVVSVKPYKSKPISFVVKQPGHDQKLVKEAREALENADCWVTYYGKMFDIPFLNTRLLRWGERPISKRPHIDMYFTLKSNIVTARKSQSHLLLWLGTQEQKMGVSADTWAQIGLDTKNITTMTKRCESDVAGLENLYDKTKHLIREITR